MSPPLDETLLLLWYALTLNFSFKKYTACFNMLKVETTPLLEVSEASRHDLQIPTIASNISDANGLLLTITINDVNITENELYTVNIITVNDNGEENSTGNIQFSKYGTELRIKLLSCNRIGSS